MLIHVRQLEELREIFQAEEEHSAATRFKDRDE
jgi:hypothetical protein